MNADKKLQIQKKFIKETGLESKPIKWNIITVETKEHPEKPKALITGNVDTIYPTGDVAFKKIICIELWSMEKNNITPIDIPDRYKMAKKIVIRREIIANVLYLEELKESDSQ